MPQPFQTIDALTRTDNLQNVVMLLEHIRLGVVFIAVFIFIGLWRKS